MILTLLILAQMVEVVVEQIRLVVMEPVDQVQMTKDLEQEVVVS